MDNLCLRTWTILHPLSQPGWSAKLKSQTNESRNIVYIWYDMIYMIYEPKPKEYVRKNMWKKMERKHHYVRGTRQILFCRFSPPKSAKGGRVPPNSKIHKNKQTKSSKWYLTGSLEWDRSQSHCPFWRHKRSFLLNISPRIVLRGIKCFPTVL